MSTCSFLAPRKDPSLRCLQTDIVSVLQRPFELQWRAPCILRMLAVDELIDQSHEACTLLPYLNIVSGAGSWRRLYAMENTYAVEHIARTTRVVFDRHCAALLQERSLRSLRERPPSDTSGTKTQAERHRSLVNRYLQYWISFAHTIYIFVDGRPLGTPGKQQWYGLRRKAFEPLSCPHTATICNLNRWLSVRYRKDGMQ